MSKKLLLFFSILFLFICCTQTRAAHAEVGAVTIKGNKRIEKETIQKRIKIQAGDQLSPALVSDSIKAIYQMGYFDDISVDLQKNESGQDLLIFNLLEKSFVTRVEFRGNSRMTTEDLKAEINISPKTFLDLKKVEEDKNHLLEFYQNKGYYNVDIYPIVDRRTGIVASMPADKEKQKIHEPKTRSNFSGAQGGAGPIDSQNAAKKNQKSDDAPAFTDKSKVGSSELAVVTFYIKEGKKSYIKSITFIGNNDFDDKKLLGTIKTSKKGWFSFLTDSGIYKKNQLEADLGLLKSLYLDQGYLEVQIGPPLTKLSHDRKWFDLTFKITEGQQYRVGKISARGMTILTESETLAGLNLKTGKLVSRSDIQADIAALTERFGSRGHLFANVSPLIDTNKEKQLADITYEINEEALVHLREVNITGNDKTRDKVIRREMRIDEQEQVDTVSLRRSYQRINNLNFFETIEMNPRRVGDDMVDININVKEKSTGTFTVGGGYSSVDRAVIIASISEGNLGGRGQLLKLNLETGRRKNSYSLTFREPYMFDKEISGTFDIFNQQRTYDTYTNKNIGGGVTLSKAFSEYLRGSLNYSRKRTDLSAVSFTAPSIVKEEFLRGATTTASTGQGLAIDTRDNPFNPHSGYKVSYYIELAKEFLGGDNRYFKAILDASRFTPVWFHNVVSYHLSVGKVWDIGGAPIPVVERFYVGGINTIRGFDYGWAGPVDSQFEAKGADKKLIINLEYLIPLKKENNFQLVFFQDTGKGFDDGERINLARLRYSAGVGIRFITPIGAIRLEWAKIIKKKSSDRQQLIEFTIGSIF